MMKRNAKAASATEYLATGVWKDIDVEKQTGIVRQKLDAYLKAIDALAEASRLLDDAASAKMRSAGNIGPTHHVHIHKGRFGKVSFVVNDINDKPAAKAKKSADFVI